MIRFALIVAVAAALLLLAPASLTEAGVVYEVNSTLDTPDAAINVVCDDGAGNCTLRAAIQEANAQPGIQTINFGIGSGHQVISPLSALPVITGPVLLDGTTQDGFAGTPLIELDGSLAGPNVTGLHITAGDSTVQALVINSWGTGGISGIGIRLEGGSGSVIQNNYIGTDATGNSAEPNLTRGIMVDDSADNTIGGTAAVRRNVISGNGERGIMVIGPAASGNVIIGNYIGTDAAGAGALANGEAGVHVQDSPGTQIGGDQPGEGNVISANEKVGVEVTNGSDNTVIQGNLIGTDASGMQPLGNSALGATAVVAPLGGGGPPPTADGIAIVGNLTEAPKNVVIGGTSEGARNVISANQGNGIILGNPETQDATITGNLIGVAIDGTTPMGNGENGVLLTDETTGNEIGSPAGPNVIAHNAGDGVRVEGAGTEFNTISGNSIHDNGGKGIETIDGGNGEMLPPVITGFGSVIGTACGGCTVDVYSDNADEGRLYEGTVTADGAGNWQLAEVPAGPFVTATATFSGNTSEFSAPVELTGGGTPTASPTPAPELIQGDMNCDGNVGGVDSLAELLADVNFSYNAEEGCPPIGDGDPQFGDVNCSGDANVTDALLVLRYAAGLDNTPVEGCVPIGEPLLG